MEKIRSFTAINAPCTTSVFLRISPYMVTEKYDRNTEPCNTEKYGRIRSMYTVVYGIVYGRKRSYTEFVKVDLGAFKLIDLQKISKEWHAVAHNNIRSVIDQRLFISELQNKQFPSDYEYSSTIQQIIGCLLPLDANPSMTKLHSIR
jgi:hypothetical protein